MYLLGTPNPVSFKYLGKLELPLRIHIKHPRGTILETSLDHSCFYHICVFLSRMPFPAKMSLLAILLLFVGVGNKIGEIAFSVLFWPDQTNPFKQAMITLQEMAVFNTLYGS